MSVIIRLSAFILLVNLSFLNSALSQDCDRFKEGKFRFTNERSRTYIIERKGDIQTELDTDTEILYAFDVEWTNSCTYVLNFKNVLANPFNRKTYEDWEPITVEILETTSNSYTQVTSMKNYDQRLQNELFLQEESNEATFEKDSIEVMSAYEGYQYNAINGLSEKAVEFLDSRTISHYADLLEKTIHADSTEVTEVGILDRMILLFVRHMATPGQITDFNGKSFLVFILDNNLLDKRAIKITELEKVTVDGDYARAQISQNGALFDANFSFFKEAGSWKLNLTSQSRPSELNFLRYIESKGLTEEEVINRALNNFTGGKTDLKVWRPLKK